MKFTYSLNLGIFEELKIHRSEVCQVRVLYVATFHNTFDHQVEQHYVIWCVMWFIPGAINYSIPCEASKTHAYTSRLLRTFKPLQVHDSIDQH